MIDLAAYAGLFASAIASATVLPGHSEVVLVGLLLKSDYSPWYLVATASAGNVLGSLVNWILGRSIERFRDRKWFPVSPEMLKRAQGWYCRYGRWSLLMSWVPVIGDPLTIVGGVMREPLWSFVLLVAIAKTARYVFVALVTLGVM